MTNGFDKLLRESLAAGADGNGADCPDAAVVAAWFDGTLSHAERTAMEAHAATCARCTPTSSVAGRDRRQGLPDHRREPGDRASDGGPTEPRAVGRRGR